MDDNGGQHHHGVLQVSRSVAAVFGIGFAFVLMAIFHLIYVAWCKNNRPNNNNNATTSETRTHDLREQEEMTSSSSLATTNDCGAHVSRLQLIVTMRYGKERKGEDECVVCLSQLVNGDEVRVLVQCGHLFHVTCIDMWLRSHPTCPLCRVNTIARIQ